MMKWLLKLGLKFVSYETLVNVIAAALAYIIDYARNNSSKDGWEKAKAAVKQVKNWTTLFDEVYEDDTLTPDEEKKIQDAIANCTATTSIYNLLKGKKAPKKDVWAKRPNSKKKQVTKKKTSTRGNSK
jgi:hypothetical protein